MPLRPIVCTSSSTRRVGSETPPIQASWITVTSAFSAVLRGFRNGGKYDPWRSLGMRSWSDPSPVEAAVAVAVMVIEPVAGALVPPGADQALDIGFHQDLQHRLRHGSQEIPVAALLQQLGQRHSVVGHRVLGQLGVKHRNSTLAGLPGDHLSLARARAPCYRAFRPTRAHRRNSTTSADTNSDPVGRRAARSGEWGAGGTWQSRRRSISWASPISGAVSARQVSALSADPQRPQTGQVEGRSRRSFGVGCTIRSRARDSGCGGS
jgi:hypothetical protein